MVRHVDADTLRGWLDERRPLTIVDVRNAEARAEWSIPGSVHVDASAAIKHGQGGPLAHVALPADRPVVAVCNAGRSSETAAAVLAARGFDAWSLIGGMKAWSLAWNAADVPLPRCQARVVQLRRTGKGCLSYLVGSNGEAAVIDPSLGPDVYTARAAAEGWLIRHVIDTHVHADHLSRGRALAALTGAALRLPVQRRVRYPFEPIADGATVAIGAATLTARQTPGHTDESLTLLLDDAAAFTGDTLFTDSVGRPDLKAADAAATRARAARLHASLTALASLPPDTTILPGHASKPIAFDGKPIAARLGDVLPWLTAWLASQADFVDRVVADLPDAPPNFARIVELNEAGAEPDVDPIELEAGANRCAIGR